MSLEGPIASISPSGQLLLPASADMPDCAVTSAAPAAADCPLPAGPDIAIDSGSSDIGSPILL
jgi:hypothetical protein